MTLTRRERITVADAAHLGSTSWVSLDIVKGRQTLFHVTAPALGHELQSFSGPVDPAHDFSV